MLTLPFPSHQRFQAQALEVQTAPRVAYQLRLPFDGRAVLHLVVGSVQRRWRRLRRRAPEGIVYFGKRQQFVAVGTLIRRVGA